MTCLCRFILLIAFTFALNTAVFAQPTPPTPPTLTPPQTEEFSGRIFTLYGDLTALEYEGSVPANTMFDLILYTRGNEAIARQRVGKGGRYSFNNIVEGNYRIGVELDNFEIARVAIHVSQRKHKPIRQDIQLTWSAALRARRDAMSTLDSYTRTPQNRASYEKALKQINKNDLPNAIAMLRSLVETDPKDYQAWNELGLDYFVQKDLNAAEKSFATAVEIKPNYMTARFSLGRVLLAQKNNEGAIAVLEAAVKTDPKSAAANYFLGEAYFVARKESVGIGYMNEAIKLDPVGMANAHLRIASFYDHSGRKDRAAIEYNEFLKKKPEHPEAQRLRDYIIANNPRSTRRSNPEPSPTPNR